MDTRAPSSERSARALAASAFISNLGDGLQFSALPLVAYLISRDPLITASVAAARVLPVVLMALPIAAWVERYRPSATMSVSLAVRAVAALLLVLLIATNGLSFVPLLLLAGVLGIADAAFDTTAGAAVVDAVPEERRPYYNSILSFSATFGVGLVGPVVGAVLFSLSPVIPFVANAVMLIASSVILALGYTGGRGITADSGSGRGFWGRILEAVKIAWSIPRLRTILILTAAWNLFGWIPEGVLVIFVREDLNESNFVYSLLLVASAAGSLLGAAVSSRISKERSQRFVLLIGTPLYGLLFIPAAFIHSWITLSVLFVIQGLPLMAWSVASATARQSLIPREALVRVNGLFYLMAVGLAPIGLMLGPLVATLSSVRATFLVAGVLLLLTSLVASWLASKAGAPSSVPTNPITAD
ncbi:MFS transporter [Curtobacterium luteum]|uniref:MFS transporter n=1 Tax=Curtobacterium luteum TaxID=33881 RepID=UPI003830ABD4